MKKNKIKNKKIKKIRVIDRRTKVLKKIVGNRGKSISKAMRDAGYSKAYSKNPKQLKKTKKWKQLMEEYLPEEKLANVHSEQLEATEIMFRGRRKYKFPDNSARLKALDLAYKLSAKYTPEQIKILRPFEHLNDEELAQYIREAKKLLLKK